MDGMSESDNASMSENGLVTVADYISRAESQSRQLPTKDTKKTKDLAQVEAIAEHSPPSATVTTNGSRSSAAEGEGIDAAKPPSPAEKPANVSSQGDSNLQPVANGLSDL